MGAAAQISTRTVELDSFSVGLAETAHNSLLRAFQWHMVPFLKKSNGTPSFLKHLSFIF
jgi:hypothetical protein